MPFAATNVRAGAALPLTTLVLALMVATAGAEELGFERTETREACDDYEPLKRPMFGDLHVHTSYSFDSYISSQRNEPPAAYPLRQGRADHAAR